MPFDDRLSRKSLELDPNWPPEWVIETDPKKEERIEASLRKKGFLFEEWFQYKLHIPNDGRKRTYKHPKVEYLLTESEYKAILDDENLALCSPVLCPQSWKKYSSQFGAVTQRFEWLVQQENFLMWGYPEIPWRIWESKKYLNIIIEELMYKPFIDFWGNLPDDFWIKLSNVLEGENHDVILDGFILIFHSQGRIFPRPQLYDNVKDPEPESLYLPDHFWM